MDGKTHHGYTARAILSGGALLMLVAGCGGGGSSTSEPASQVLLTSTDAGTCTPRRVRIQLFGDSTLWGWDGGGNGERASVYPELALQRAMDDHFGPGSVSVATRAVSGTLTTHLIAGTDGLNKPWPGSVEAELVVVNFGINDRLHGLPPEDYKANLRRLAVAPAKVVFQTPLPVWNSSSTQPISLSMAAEMRQVAQEFNLPVADASAFALATPNWYSRQYAPDGVHPNSAGYQAIVSNVLAPALFPWVSAARCP